jgi:flagellar protein FliJ
MFVFGLQSVLDYRKNIEEKILSEFSEKKRQLETEELRLHNLVTERESLISELRKMQDRSLYADEIARYVNYVEQIRGNEEKQKKVIIDVQEQLEALRKELLEAVRREKVMEKLKERHAEEYEGAMRALEQKNSDEMSVLKFGWRQK